MPLDIQFPKVNPRYVFERDCLAFVASVDGKPVECLISAELLMHRFGARGFTEPALREAFSLHENEIHEIARHHIQMGWINRENLVILTTRFTNLKIKYDDDLQKRPRELEVAQRIVRILAEVIGPGSGEVSIEVGWEVKDGHPIFTVILSDPSGIATNWFNERELGTASNLRVWLVRLWGDFLQLRSHKLIQQSG